MSEKDKATLTQMVDKLSGLSKDAAQQARLYLEGFAAGYASRSNEKREEEA